ncbi:type II CAAX prenyl endopeptidase Rce1 family protein [Tahibacter sp. UC22_41]|uniref:CPBP family glutamic-type intramembrane protease n=1 Tax=Tahibacter sp. UC22_41 TaxID=3350178 RepID=UPI0036D80ADA
MHRSIWRQAVTMWLAGFAGVVVIAVGVVPALVAGKPLPLPVWAVSLIAAVQSGGLLALAVWSGLSLAPRVGLRAPLFEAIAAAAPLGAALRPQWLPGLLGGLVAGGVLLALSAFAPAELTAAAPALDLPLAARLLYGGITEELLLRWGLMSALLWLFWRLLQRGSGRPSMTGVALAVAAAALLFGLGHLPAARALAGGLTLPVVAYVVGANAVFGMLAGGLFWRYGLEAAMLAHATAHLLLYFAA